MTNIISKENKANGIIKVLQYLVRGLGKYTLEGGMIYLNSLLRSSILYASEAMYNVKENELRQIERIEENMLGKLFKTVQGCPIYQIYFASGHLPAWYQIKSRKLVFYKNIFGNEQKITSTFISHGPKVRTKKMGLAFRNSENIKRIL